jgi:hypothetical protein
MFDKKSACGKSAPSDSGRIPITAIPRSRGVKFGPIHRRRVAMAIGTTLKKLRESAVQSDVSSDDR